MEGIEEEFELNFKGKDVNLQVMENSLKSMAHQPELERETLERKRGRDILVAIDHSQGSKHAFDWAIAHLCRMADTIHFIHVVSNVDDEALYGAACTLIEKLAAEAFEVSMVQSKGRIVEGDVAKVICAEAARIRPAALVLGTRGMGIIKSSLLHKSVSQYCFHHSICPVIVVPSKESGDQSVI